MIKIVLIGVLLGAVVFFDVFRFTRSFIVIDRQWDGYRVVRYRLDGKEYKLLVADTADKQTKGLMGVKTLTGEIDGMIFQFNNEAYRSFWNKNTHLDLDVYWIAGEKTVGYERLPSIDVSGLRIIHSPLPADTVIELVR